MFSGVVGAPGRLDFPNPPYTTLATTPVSREKPYLFIDSRGNLAVRVPAARTNTSGTTWAGGVTPGARCRSATSSSPIRRTRRGDRQPARPGQAPAAHARRLRHRPQPPVKRANTVVLGLGHATLTADDGAMPLTSPTSPASSSRGSRSTRARRSPGADAGRRRGGHGRRKHGHRVRPDHAVRRVLPRRRAAHRPGRDGARDQQRPRADRPHLGVAGRPRRRGLHRHAALGHEPRPQRRRRQRRRRDRERPVRRALPAVQHRLERRGGITILYQNELPYDPPTQADWMHGERRGLGRLQGRRPGSGTTSTAVACTSSTGTTRRSTPRTASRCRRRPACGSTTS